MRLLNKMPSEKAKKYLADYNPIENDLYYTLNVEFANYVKEEVDDIYMIISNPFYFFIYNNEKELEELEDDYYFGEIFTFIDGEFYFKRKYNRFIELFHEDLGLTVEWISDLNRFMYLNCYKGFLNEENFKRKYYHFTQIVD